MLAVYDPNHALHAPATYVLRGTIMPARENPSRADALLQGLRDGGHQIIPPRDFGLAPVAAVHTQGYLDFLAGAYEHWQSNSGSLPRGSMVVAHAFAMRHMARLPSNPEGQIGYYLSGGSVPIDAGTWQAMRGAANCALEAAAAIATGVRHAYALCRPPGHHAYADLAGGFCYLNNAAIAAEYLRMRMGRVAILDVDVHHGNGTQGIFYDRGDVHFVSLHADPNNAYPWYAGYADETGEGDGQGHTLNLPLPLGTEDPAFLGALDRGIASLSAFGPSALVVSLGLDAYRDDPSALLSITTEGFRAIGARIGALALPVVLIQEGGYAVEALGRNLSSFLAGFLSARPAASP